MGLGGRQWLPLTRAVLQCKDVIPSGMKKGMHAQSEES